MGFCGRRVGFGGRRGGVIYHWSMGAIRGGNVTFNNNGYRPIRGVDHITVWGDGGRVSWNMQNGEVAPDSKGKREPHYNRQ